MYKEKTELLTCDEAIEYLRCGYNTLYKLLESGELKAYKDGSRWKIPYGSITEYILRRSNLQ